MNIQKKKITMQKWKKNFKKCENINLIMKNITN